MTTCTSSSSERRRALACVLAAFGLAAGGVSAFAQGPGVTLHLDRVPLRSVCDTLITAFGVPLVYLDRDVQAETVSVDCDGCGVDEILDAALGRTPLMWKKVDRQFILSPRPAPAPGPEGSLWGTVVDSATGEFIADALVLLYRLSPHAGGRGPAMSPVPEPPAASAHPSRSTQSNVSGFFSFRRVPAGTYRLVARMVGRREASLECAVTGGTESGISIPLTPDEIFLNEVVVTAGRSAFSAAGGAGGSVARGVFVPAAPADQNQYFLEGERVYNPSHYGGVVSTFSEDALTDVDPRTGGIPSYYGGRIGGILDLTLREGSLAGIRGSAGAGSLGSSLSLEGPVTGTATFIVSGRQGYPDLAGPAHSGAGRLSDAHSSELLSKVTLRASPTDRFSLTGYFGRDVYRNAPVSPAARLGNEFRWRNAAASLRWSGMMPPGLFLQARAGFSGYDLAAAHDWNDLAGGGSESYGSEYRIGDATLSADAEHYYDDWHTFRGGVEIVRHAMSGSVSLFTSQLVTLPWSQWSAWELAVHLQDRWRLAPGVLAEVGARATSFLGRDGPHSAIDPRFSLFASLTEALRLHAGLTSVTQFLHPYRNSGIFLFYPSIFWYPSTISVRPSASLQLLAGLERDFAGGAHTAGADVYYRLARDIHEFSFAQVPSAPSTLDDVIRHGDARAWGVQLTVRSRAGAFEGLVRYNLSWLKHRFDSLNSGRSFVPRFHRTHEVVADIAFGPGDGWTLGLLASIASDQSPSFSQQVFPEVAGSPRGGYDLNGSRLPGFERLEVRFTRAFRLASGIAQATLSLLNDYGLLDPYEWRISPSGDLRQRWEATLRRGSLVPRYPAVSMAVNF